MTRTKIESNLERQFLVAMIVNKTFISSIGPTLDVSLLAAKYSQIVAEWCLSYFKLYGEAPGKALVSIYHAWVEKEKPAEVDAESIHDLLESLSQQFDATPEPINTLHLLDELTGYLNLRRVEKLKQDITYSVTFGKVDEAIAAIEGFRRISINGTVGYDPTKSQQALIRAFAEPMDPIIKFPGPAADFFDPALTRDALIGVQGVEKRGKTWWCLEFVHRTIAERRKVAMFEVGDLTEPQLTRRMAMRMAEIPMWLKQCREGVRIPTDIKLVHTEDGKKPEIAHMVQTYPSPLNQFIARRAQKDYQRNHSISPNTNHVMFSAHPTGTINVAGIQTILERWKNETGFVPDVIVIDYADILAPEDYRRDPRHQVNETWAALRRLSQVWHACVITPTQANATAYEAKTQRLGMASEDKRKLAHVTGHLGLNQSDDEKRQGIMRLNWIVLRESEFLTDRCLYVAQCIPLGQALVRSVM